MTIDNKHRNANWQQIAAEFESERDALRGDVYRMQQERDTANAELATLRAELTRLRVADGELRKDAERLDDSMHVLDAIAQNRCYACGWTLSDNGIDGGCVPFNCSYRPAEANKDHDNWLSRAHRMEEVRALAKKRSDAARAAISGDAQ